MKPFPWRPGMLSLPVADQPARRIIAILPSGYPWGVREGDTRRRPDLGVLRHDAQPDETDPATLGALRDAVRQERGEPRGFVLPPGAMSTGWVYLPNGDTSPLWVEGDGQSTEFAALIAAREATP